MRAKQTNDMKFAAPAFGFYVRRLQGWSDFGITGWQMMRLRKIGEWALH